MLISNNSERMHFKQLPQVTFGLNEALDFCKINDTLSVPPAEGGYTFQEDFMAELPQFKEWALLPEKDRKQVVGLYVRSFYQKNKNKLQKATLYNTNAWAAYSPQFFKATSKLFKGLLWPPGEYEGYLTILHWGPRWLDNKIFQVPFDDSKAWIIKDTAHEMLHFIFYEYVRQRYTPQLPNTLEQDMNILLNGRFQIPLWELSEVFNDALLTDKDFGKGGEINPQPYPALVGYLQTFQKIWQQVNGNIDDFFTKIEVS